jgi:bacterioferritin-associated ferredoxin
MRCYSDQELVQAELGELTINQVKDLDDHAAVCSCCAQARQAIRQLTEDLAPRPSQEDDFVERVMSARKTVTPIAPARRPHVSWFAAAALVLLAAGTAKVAMDYASHKETWTARGHRKEANVSLDTPASEVLVMRGGQLLPLSGQSLSPSDAFAVRYVNPTDDTQYLAAFAVDAAGAVHWIFPEYVDASTDPPSIPLASAEEERLLPQVVAPENPAPGPMHVVTLTSHEPTTVKHIENALQEASSGMSAGHVLAQLYPNALIREWSCSWNAR